MRKDNQTIVITGGHHNSALVLARRLRKKGLNIIWIGHRYSMWGDTALSAEYREVASEGIKFIELRAGKFYRTYHPLKLIRIPLGFFQALWILLKIHPQGVVSFGGYLAVPVVIAAWILGIPVITHEQTAISGYANRLIGFFSRKIAVSWPSSLAYYPPGKTLLTGLPLRPEITAAKADRLKNLSGIKSSKIKTVLVTGGKQGSHAINNCIFSSLPDLLHRYNIIHQTGSSTIFNDFKTAQKIRKDLTLEQQSKYLVYDYISSENLRTILSQVSLVISRAGAHIIYELAYLGIPAVLIPIPQSSHSEQNANARILISSGQAVLLEQKDLSPESLSRKLDEALTLSPEPIVLETGSEDKLEKLIFSEIV